jgi:hypothetical protein
MFAKLMRNRNESLVLEKAFFHSWTSAKVLDMSWIFKGKRKFGAKVTVNICGCFKWNNQNIFSVRDYSCINSIKSSIHSFLSWTFIKMAENIETRIIKSSKGKNKNTSILLFSLSATHTICPQNILLPLHYSYYHATSSYYYTTNM